MIGNFVQDIGNYRLTATLGKGACGHVFLGRHVLLPNRLVAIKVMKATPLHSLEEQERFRREAQFLDWLKHPHILPVIDVGVCKDYSYLVTEYASNGSLKDLLDQQPHRLLSEERALGILSQIGQALQYAHENGVVHRDLKPANILFNTKGDALLADFGIAMLLSRACTEPAEVAGTPAYMAPEQFQQVVSCKSDQYALGCIAYELFTGHPPFSAMNFYALALKQIREQPLPLTCHNPSISPSINQAVLKAMAKERSDRHTDIATFLAALLSSQRKESSSHTMRGIAEHSLEQVLKEREGPLDEVQVLVWMMHLCELVYRYHSQRPAKFVGEITPEQVLVTPSGDVRLRENKGIQRSDLDAHYRDVSKYQGEYSYISPEALRQKYNVSDKEKVDARSVIYSLGAILFLLLTNCLPEPLRTPAPGSILAKNPALHVVGTNSSRTCLIEQVIITAMQQDPNRRFQSAKALRAALQYCLMLCKQERGLEDVLRCSLSSAVKRPCTGYLGYPF
jgi:serine/threonine protein kinase